jgi:hypothetical protein
MRLQPDDRISVAIPADLIESVEQVADQRHCSYGDAIAHLLRQALHPAAEIPAVLTQELTDLRDRLTAIERDRTLAIDVAVLSDRLSRLEASVLSVARSNLLPTDPLPSTNPPLVNLDEDEDWGQYEDEPDEVLHDFLPSNS